MAEPFRRPSDFAPAPPPKPPAKPAPSPPTGSGLGVWERNPEAKLPRYTAETLPPGAVYLFGLSMGGAWISPGYWYLPDGSVVEGPHPDEM